MIRFKSSVMSLMDNKARGVQAIQSSEVEAISKTDTHKSHHLKQKEDIDKEYEDFFSEDPQASAPLDSSKSTQ